MNISQRKNINTKEKILQESLSLFAEKGYDGTSMEAVADKVGIKAPSLYKHFKGKEEILNQLIAMAERRYEENFGSKLNVGKIPESHRQFIEENMERVAFTMRDEMIRKIRIFLVKEQFRNKRLAKITSMHQIKGPQKMYEKIIAAMIAKKLFRKADPALMALQLIAPVSLLIAKADREEESQEECLKAVRKHLKHFCETYR
ncbi:MAG: TetR/AcrR family transcriptional regulator [Erysipelotrichaceae bacterium]|nr:TetR/AcrR family transcriptional regulator [Erysipelotrichaceae bacterium]